MIIRSPTISAALLHIRLDGFNFQRHFLGAWQLSRLSWELLGSLPQNCHGNHGGKWAFTVFFYHVLHHQNWINLDLWFSRCSDNPIWCSQFLIPFLTIRLSFVTISAASPESCSTWEESDGSCFCTLKLGGFYLRLIKLISFHIYQTYFSDLCNLMWSISSLYLCISISSDCHGKIVESHCSSGCQVGLSQGSHMTEQSRDVVLEALRLAVQNWSMTCCIDCDSNDWSIFMATSETPPTIWFLFGNVKQADKNDMFGVNMLDKKKDMNMTSSNLSRKVPRYSHGYSHSCHGPSILVFTYVIPQKISDIGRNHIIQYSVVRIIWSWLSSISGTSLDLPYILCILYYIYRYIDITDIPAETETRPPFPGRP